MAYLRVPKVEMHERELRLNRDEQCFDMLVNYNKNWSGIKAMKVVNGMEEEITIEALPGDAMALLRQLAAQVRLSQPCNMVLRLWLNKVGRPLALPASLMGRPFVPVTIFYNIISDALMAESLYLTVRDFYDTVAVHADAMYCVDVPVRCMPSEVAKPATVTPTDGLKCYVVAK